MNYSIKFKVAVFFCTLCIGLSASLYSTQSRAIEPFTTGAAVVAVGSFIWDNWGDDIEAGVGDMVSAIGDGLTDMFGSSKRPGSIPEDEWIKLQVSCKEAFYGQAFLRYKKWEYEFQTRCNLKDLSTFDYEGNDHQLIRLLIKKMPWESNLVTLKAEYDIETKEYFETLTIQGEEGPIGKIVSQGICPDDPYVAGGPTCTRKGSPVVDTKYKALSEGGSYNNLPVFRPLISVAERDTIAKLAWERAVQMEQARAKANRGKVFGTGKDKFPAPEIMGIKEGQEFKQPQHDIAITVANVVDADISAGCCLLEFAYKPNRLLFPVTYNPPSLTLWLEPIVFGDAKASGDKKVLIMTPRKLADLAMEKAQAQGLNAAYAQTIDKYYGAGDWKVRAVLRDTKTNKPVGAPLQSDVNPKAPWRSFKVGGDAAAKVAEARGTQMKKGSQAMARDNLRNTAAKTNNSNLMGKRGAAAEADNQGRAGLAASSESNQLRRQSAAQMRKPVLAKPGAKQGFNPQPDPPKTREQMLTNPAAKQGFNPQPDPPKASKQALSNPAAKRGFNPQPDPPIGAIRVSSVFPSPAQPKAGDQIGLTLRLKNTGKSKSGADGKIQVSCRALAGTCPFRSGQYPINRAINANGSYDLKLSAMSKAKEGRYEITVLPVGGKSKDAQTLTIVVNGTKSQMTPKKVNADVRMRR